MFIGGLGGFLRNFETAMTETKLSKPIELEVHGMTCTNCALSVRKYLEKQNLKNVNVNFASGEVNFEAEVPVIIQDITKGIEQLGYQVVKIQGAEQGVTTTGFLNTLKGKLIFCSVFTLPLLLHMFVTWPLLHHHVFQLFISLPVYFVGLYFFGRSAVQSIKNGLPNMDVLIATGAGAALIYSVWGTWMFWGTHQVHDYLFFETGATIITLVLLGNWIEHLAVQKTTTAIADLKAILPTHATLISKDENGFEISAEILTDQITKGDILFVRSGENIPADGIIINGKGLFDEAAITGESLPLNKTKGDGIISGTLLIDGALRFEATTDGQHSTLAHIIQLVKNAQAHKPQIQKIGDKVSAVFVQVVISIALITFFVTWLALNLPFQVAMMRAIAVLVISCPCAMGLATPTAIMVGLGRGAKSGLLVKGGDTIEELAKAQTIVFDKTGTLTTGEFTVAEIKEIDNTPLEEIKNLLYHLEQHSSHPIAKSIVRQKEWMSTAINFTQITEEKGLGLSATDEQGNTYRAGSLAYTQRYFTDDSYDLYVVKNETPLACLRISDELKPGAKEAIAYFTKLGITPIILSGDKLSKVQSVADELKISDYHAGVLPEQKNVLINHYKQKGKTIMVGDGINDAIALSTAHVGISLSGATAIAQQSAQVIIKGENLLTLVHTHRLSVLTYQTIKQNLFWALAYNLVAIPIAAAGYLSPMIGALSMAFSDVVVIGNSLRLRFRKL